MPDNDPANPTGDPDREAERSGDPSDPSDPDTRAAILRERGPGAHEEKVGDDANLRADDTAPGVDPDEDA